MSALLPRNTNPWPDGYHSLADSMKPIDPLETSKHPGQTFNLQLQMLGLFLVLLGILGLGGNLQLQLYQYLIVSGRNPQHDLHYLLVELLLIIDRPLMHAHPRLMFPLRI